MSTRTVSPLGHGLRHSVPPKLAGSTLAWALYRIGLVVTGLIWICFASTLCGCNAANGWVMNRSGQAYYNRGNYTAARYEFERALMDNPRNPHYAYNVAQAMEQQGELESAEQMYQHALTLDPSHQPAYHGLAEMLIDQGREDDAGALLQAWAETQPYLPESNLELADMYQRRGNVAGAQRYVQQAMRAHPRNPQAYARMGRIYQQSGQPQLAASWYQRSLAMNPYQPEVTSQYMHLGTGAAPTPALHMARTMPRYDPTMMGGFHFSGSPQTFLATPQPSSAMMVGTPLTGRTLAMPAGPAQAHFPPNYGPGAPVPQAPLQGSPTFAPTQQFTAPQPPPQPIQLGQPVPVSHDHSGSAPMIGTAIPAVQPF